MKDLSTDCIPYKNTSTIHFCGRKEPTAEYPFPIVELLVLWHFEV